MTTTTPIHESNPMHAAITPEVAADRLAIRQLIDAYAHHADRRQPEDQAALYAEDGRTLLYADPSASEPTQVLTGHAEHVEGFRAGLAPYAATMHFNGQSSIELDGDHATGESYCLAHHLLETEEGRTLLVLFIRYQDSFVKRDGTWRFAERKLLIDWSDSRPSHT
jgi:SnoaL-like domain